MLGIYTVFRTYYAGLFMFHLHARFYLLFIDRRHQTEGLLITLHSTNKLPEKKVAYFWEIYYHALATKRGDATTTQLRASVGLLWMQETEIQAFHPSIANISSHKQWLQWTSCRIVQRPY
jgi:hypothetical protein